MLKFKRRVLSMVVAVAFLCSAAISYSSFLVFGVDDVGDIGWSFDTKEIWLTEPPRYEEFFVITINSDDGMDNWLADDTVVRAKVSEVVIGEDVNVIPQNAFGNGEQLRVVTFEGNVLPQGFEALVSLPKVSVIHYPNNPALKAEFSGGKMDFYSANFDFFQNGNEAYFEEVTADFHDSESGEPIITGWDDDGNATSMIGGGFKTFYEPIYLNSGTSSIKKGLRLYIGAKGRSPQTWQEYYIRAWRDLNDDNKILRQREAGDNIYSNMSWIINAFDSDVNIEAEIFHKDDLIVEDNP